MQAEDDVALDLKGILAALARRSLLIAGVTLAVGIGSFALLSAMPPRYQSETKLLIENREPSLTRDVTTAPDRAVIDQETVASQVQLLTSRDLARRVADRFKLADRTEFDGSRGGLLDGVLVAVGLGRDPLRTSPEERVIDAFMEHLQVYRVEGSRVIVVQFHSRDRELAASVADGIATEYMALQGEAKRLTSGDQTRWLGDEIEKLRDRVREAEAAVERYRSGSDLFTGENNTTLARQQITDLTNSLATARADKAAAESRAALLARLLKGGGDLSAAADVVDSDTFRSLRTREAGLRNRLSELSVTMLPGHPQIKTVQSQIADIEAQQVAEARRVLAGLQNDAKVAAGRIESLTDGLGQLKATQAENGENEVELRALEREAAAQRSLLESLLVRYREAVARENATILPADARIISRAAVPVEPTFPKVVPLTIVATVAGFLLSVAWVVAGEFLSGRALMRIPFEPEAPRVVAGRRAARPVDERDDDDADEPFDDDAPEATSDARRERFRRLLGAARAGHGPVHTDGEAFDGDEDDDRLPMVAPEHLYAMLIRDGAVRIAVLGVGSADGVGRAVAGLSRIALQDGTRVVVVDTVGAGGEEMGLSDLVAGDADFSEIIRRNPATRAHQIAAGRAPIDEMLIAGDDMETMLAALEHTYDLVVLDLGPMEPDAARFGLVTAADHVVLVGEDHDPEVVQAFHLLDRHGVERLSILSESAFARFGAAA